MKKLFIMLLGFALVVSLVLAGCSAKPATTPASPTTKAPSPTPTPTPTPQPSQVIKLTWASAGAPMVAYEKYYQDWADMLKQETGGRVEIKVYYSESLVKMAESFTATEKGVCDISGFGISIDPSRVPLNMVSMLPLLGTNDNNQVATRVQNELIKKYPEMAAEFKNVKLLVIYAPTSRSISMVKKKVLVPDDIKGAKIIVTGIAGQMFAGMGSAALPLSPPEWSTSLSTGLAEGIASPLDAVDTFNALDAVPYHLYMPGDDLGWGTTCIIMNKDSWNKLPADVQKLIDEKYAPMLQQKLLEIQAGLSKGSIEKAKTKGHTFVTCTPEQYKLWADAFAVQIEKLWITPNEAKGLPARAIYNDFKQLAKQYSQK